MKCLTFRAVALLLALFLVLSGLSACSAPPAPSDAEAVPAVDNMRGLYLHTGSDFPSSADLSADALKAELDAAVAFASQNGFHTIFYEAVTGAQAMYNSGKYPYSNAIYTENGFFSRFGRFDPLDYLVKTAAQKNIDVAAVISPFSAAPTTELPTEKAQLAAKHSQYVKAANDALWFDVSEPFTSKLAVATAKELAKKYALSAIVLRDFAYPTADFELRSPEAEKQALLTQLLTDIGAAARKQRPNIQIGIQSAVALEVDDTGTVSVAGGGYDGSADLSGWLRSGTADFAVASPAASIEQGYEHKLSGWSALRDSLGEHARIYTINTAQPLAQAAEAEAPHDPLELESQLYLNHRAGLDGAIISGYHELQKRLPETVQSITASFAPPPDLPLGGFDLTYPDEFVITRPSQAITVSTPTYYITGLSGGAPVLLDGEAIGSGRTFGVLVQLKQGRNEFTFTSGEQTQTAVITYGSSGGSSTPATITEPRQSSLFPSRQALTYPGDDVTLSCIAPSGAKITARVGEESVELTQEAPAEDGIPAFFSGRLTIPAAYPANETTPLGPTVYTVSYDGQSNSYASTGELFAIGKQARLAVEVISQRGDTSSVNTAADFRDNMIGSVEQGARDYVTEWSSSFFRLSCGGWIARDDVSVLTGSEGIDADATGAPLFSADERGETFSLGMGGARPYYLTSLTDETLTVTFYNTSGIAEHWDTSDSRLFSEITAKYDGDTNSTQITFRLNKPLWGYNVEYHDDEVWLFGKYTPRFSNEPGKPLTGLTIVVDAGHGGNDPGAIGVAGELGPAEKQLNYINARFVSARLEQLGATVIQTQTADERLSYARRMDPARDNRADFYICLHHNSTAESVDSTNARGVEVYYIEQLSKPFAAAMAEELSAATGRKNRGAMFASFRVTQMTHTPSLLVELGFVVSPAEYEELCEPLSVYRASIGVCNAVLRAVREANAEP